MKKLTRLLISGILAMCILTACGNSAASSSASKGAESGSASASSSSKQSSDSSEKSASKTVSFGTYQGQPIEWYVLKSNKDQALLLSVHALDSRPFSEGPAQWETSSLRSWLNGDFYNEAFTPEEQSNILLSSLKNGDDLNYGTTAGADTEDHVFLLSASEAKEYLSGKETTTAPTDYAASQGAYTNEKGNCAWWLRSPGMNEDGPAYYSSQGDIGTRAHQGSENIIGVRPAVWVNASVISS